MTIFAALLIVAIVTATLAVPVSEPVRVRVRSDRRR